MIFVTVGSQLGFDRLVGAVDAWAASRSGAERVLAQIGGTAAAPRHCEWVHDLAPDDFDAAVEGADVVVGHAGTGTIMAALTRGKPVVVLARREALGETRNDHQVATIARFRGFAGFFGTVDEAEIGPAIERALGAADAEASAPGPPDPGPPDPGPRAPGPLALAPFATGPLVERLRAFLDEHLA